MAAMVSAKQIGCAYSGTELAIFKQRSIWGTIDLQLNDLIYKTLKQHVIEFQMVVLRVCLKLNTRNMEVATESNSCFRTVVFQFNESKRSETTKVRHLWCERTKQAYLYDETLLGAAHVSGWKLK
eukprot:55831_1